MSLRTSWTYDHNSRVKLETDALNRRTTYTYTPVGQLESRLDARGVLATFSYDNDRRLTGHEYSDGTRFTFTYDKVANRKTMADPTGTTTFTYDSLNRTDTATNAAGRLVTYSYDAVSQKIKGDAALFRVRSAVLRGRPRGRRVCPSPRFFAVEVIQSASANGQPRRGGIATPSHNQSGHESRPRSVPHQTVLTRANQ